MKYKIESEKNGQNENQGKATFEIKNFSQITGRYYTEPAEICGRKWRILVFPQGNKVDGISLYLDLINPKEGFCDARFTIEVVDQNAGTHSVKRESTHRFNEKSSDWGFTAFMKMTHFLIHNGEYLKEDKMVIHVNVELMMQNRNAGLKRYYQSTFFMNSVLHTLYYIPMFCKQVFQLKNPQNNIVKVLQSTFYRLKFEGGSVGTNSLRKSLGWADYPHNVIKQKTGQQLLAALLENLMKETKGTEAGDILVQLFQGTMKSFVKCVNVDFEVIHVENFLDISLSTEGCANVLESFEKLVEVEKSISPIKDHGLQEVQKGKKFLAFPPILILHIKRARQVDYHFPEVLNLSSFVEESNQSAPPTFCLHAVLVCHEELQRESYFTYIRLTPMGEWFIVYDDRVAPMQPVLVSTPKTFAYMLVYFRQDDIPYIFPPISSCLVPLELHSRAENEAKVREKRNIDGTQLLALRIMTHVHLRPGSSGIVVHFTGKKFKFWKAASVKEVKCGTGKHYGLEPKHQVFWKCKERGGTLFEIDSPVLEKEEDISIHTLAHQTEYCLFLAPSSSPPHSADIFLLLMAYDPFTESLQSIGYVVTRNTNTIVDLFPIMRSRINESPLTPLLVYRAKSQSLGFFLLPLSPLQKLHQLGLRNCSILVFQRQPIFSEFSSLRFPTVPAYFSYLFHTATTYL